MAEWTKVNSDEMGAQYIDLGRMQRNGELVKIWTVIDYKEPRKMLGKIFRSVVVQEEYDCENELQRVLFVVANSGQMAAGAAVISDPQVTNWQPTPPGSSGEMFLMLACGK
ncbi:MAG: surface-adhesin E family protein [Pseudomonas sp.]